MRTATLTTHPDSEDAAFGTFGNLTLDDGTKFASGELPWHSNANGVSCIPATEQPYLVEWINSPKHGECYQIKGVQGRDMIEIHSANFMGDKSEGFECQLLGCLALGTSIGKLEGHKQTALLGSKIAIAAFEKNMNKEPFMLTVVRNF